METSLIELALNLIKAQGVAVTLLIAVGIVCWKKVLPYIEKKLDASDAAQKEFLVMMKESQEKFIQTQKETSKQFIDSIERAFRHLDKNTKAIERVADTVDDLQSTLNKVH